MAVNDKPAATSPSERRRFQRITFTTNVKIGQHDFHWITDLHDISFKGALTSKPANWQTADLTQPFTIDVVIDEENHIQFVASLTHQEADKLGFHCVNMDIDSASTLRRLVELNLGDPALLERELTMLVSSD